MPIRGENIGTAYIRIVGDGSGLPNDIRDGFHDAEPSVREAGERHGNVYSDAVARRVKDGYERNFGEGNTQSNIFERLNQQLTRSLSRLELADRTFKSAKWKEFRRRLVDEGGAAGDLFAQRLEQSFRDSGNLDALPDAMARYGPGLRQAQADILKQLAADREADDRRTLQQGRMVLQARAMMEREFADRQRRIQDAGRTQDAAIAEDRRRSLTALRRDLASYLETLQRVERGERGVRASRLSIVRDFDSIRDRASRAGIGLDEVGDGLDDMDRRLRRAHPGLLRFNRVLDDTANRVGRVFGKGSRNNLLNFIGGLGEGVTRIGLLVPRALGKAFGAVSDFRLAFRQATDAQQSFFKAFSAGGIAAIESFGGAASTGAAGLLTMAAAAAIAVVAVGPLVALLAVLAGGLIALVGSAFFALAAGVTALVAVLLPAAGALAGIGLAIAYVKANGDDLQKAFDGVVKSFGRVSDAFGDAAFRDIGDQAHRLSQILEGFTPLARGIGRAFRTYVSSTLDSLDSPAFKRWRDVMSKQLPGLMTSLGESINNTLGGLGGIFADMLPEVRRFLDWLEDITQEFSNWANSKKGRDEILDFFGKARESAKVWGDLLGNVVELFATLFDNGGKDAGDTIVGDLSDKIQEFTDYLNANPDAIKNWFGDVTDTMRSIGRLAEQVANLIDKFDSPGNRDAVSGFFGIISSALGPAQVAVSVLFGGFGRLRRIIGFVSDAVTGLGDHLGDALGGIRDAFSHFALPNLNTGRMITGVTGLGPRLVKAMGKANVSDIITGTGKALGHLTGTFVGANVKVVRTIGKSDVSKIIIGTPRALSSLINPFTGANRRVLSAIGKVAVDGIITGANVALARLVSTFGSAARRILDTIGNVNVAGIISGAGEAAQNLVNAFSGLASRIVSAIGTIVPHISMPDIPGVPGVATGGTFGQVTNGAMLRWVGEDGPEAIVPLNRPLHEVDPSVRALSAIAQGLSSASSGPSGGSSIGKQINASFTVTTPVADPMAVAVAMVDRLAAVGGY